VDARLQLQIGPNIFSTVGTHLVDTVGKGILCKGKVVSKISSQGVIMGRRRAPGHESGQGGRMQVLKVLRCHGREFEPYFESN
jgi:hypothetical protein